MKEVILMPKHWDPTDTSTHWEIERQIKAIMNGSRVRYYDRWFEGSVEDVYVHTDGTADVDLYGKDNNDRRGHFHFHLRLHPDGSFNIENCH